MPVANTEREDDTIHYIKEEQETSIVWDDQEKVAKIYSSSTTSIKRLDKLVASHPDIYKCTWSDQDGTAKKYEVDRKFIKFRRPATEAQLRAARENGEKLAQKKKDDAL